MRPHAALWEGWTVSQGCFEMAEHIINCFSSLRVEQSGLLPLKKPNTCNHIRGAVLDFLQLCLRDYYINGWFCATKERKRNKKPSTGSLSAFGWVLLLHIVCCLRKQLMQTKPQLVQKCSQKINFSREPVKCTYV